MIVHAGFKTFLAVTRHGVSGHGDDRQILKPRIVTNRLGCFKSTHHRHLYIHEHYIKLLSADHLQGLFPVVGNAHDQSRLLQNFFSYLLVDLIIFRQQYSCPANLLQLYLISTARPHHVLTFCGLFPKGDHYCIKKHGLAHRFKKETVGAHLLGSLHDLFTTIGCRDNNLGLLREASDAS